MTEEEYNNRNQELHNKVQKGEPLNKGEQFFFCAHLPFKSLLKYSFCEDEFFYQTYFALNGKNIDENFSKHLQYTLSSIEVQAYCKILETWEASIEKTNHSNQLLQIVSKETREELKILKKSNSLSQYGIIDKDYEQRKFKIIEWSKFRYIKVKNFFESTLNAAEFKLFLNGNEIIFNYYSYTHILTRHFGRMMKPYQVEKSHFSQDISVEEIHLQLEDIFKKIDNSNFFIEENIEEINLKLNGNLYKIFNKQTIENGKNILRLSSFFPIDNPLMLERLDNEFTEKKINNNLSIFIKIK